MISYLIDGLYVLFTNSAHCGLVASGLGGTRRIRITDGLHIKVLH